MLYARKGSRSVYAMIMNEDVNGVAGVAQCAIDGCQAYIPLMVGPEEDTVSVQVYGFMMTHECDPNRFPGKKAIGN